MAAGQLPARNELAEADKWNLTPLFPSDSAWEALFGEVQEQIGQYAQFRGRLGDSAEALLGALDFHLGLTRRLERLHTYAHLRNDEDRSNGFYLGLFQRALGLQTRALEACCFISPEIMQLPADLLADFQREPRLAPYRFYLEKVLRLRPHTLGASEEQILAMTHELSQAPSQIFGQLDNVDLKFGDLVDGRGRRVQLSHGNFVRLLADGNREVRKKAFFQYYDTYDRHKYTIASALSHSVKKDLFYARARRFADCRQAALFGDDVPAAVYDNLIETVKYNLEPLMAYLDFRKAVLGLESLHFYDTYVPVVKEVAFHMPYEEAVEVCTAACAPLGEGYAAVLREGLLGGWVDRYENRGKRSGAFSSGCYDSPPYILLNYDAESISSLYTLIHEAGHSMHSWYARKHQPYIDHEYTIFVAEVASTFNETLLGHHLLKRYRGDPAMQAFILNREIDNLRATLFRQTMFAEFEQRIHEIAERNAPLTLERMMAVYHRLLETYFADHLVLDAVLDLECLRIPHFYAAFYVYKYATGVSAAITLARRVLSGDSAAAEAFMCFLKLGGSRFPIDALAAAGVDMRSPEPVERAIAHFADLVQRLQAVYSA